MNIFEHNNKTMFAFDLKEKDIQNKTNLENIFILFKNRVKKKYNYIDTSKCKIKWYSCNDYFNKNKRIIKIIFNHFS